MKNIMNIGLFMALMTMSYTAHAQTMDAVQLQNIKRLQSDCSSVAEAVMQDSNIASAEMDQCVHAFQQSAKYYVEKLVANDVGYAQGCQDALQPLPADTEVDNAKANNIAQQGWTCLATYASSPASAQAFQELGFNIPAYEATSVIPYCISAASGEVTGEALQTERQGCINGIRRHRMLVKEQGV